MMQLSRKREALHATEVTAHRSQRSKSNSLRPDKQGCYCGGSGGGPSMKPICRACAQTDRDMREVGLCRLVGLVGFAP